MSSPFGGQALPSPEEPGQAAHPLVLWDTSSAPASNEFGEKLGSLGGQMGAIGGLFDEDTLSVMLLDGYHRGEPVSSILPFDPDNWTPRLHSEKGKGKDNSWALRLIADHTQKAQTRDTRSTFVVDGANDQSWGNLMDIFRILERKTPVDDAELRYTLAGFLEIFSGAKDPKERPDGPETPSQTGSKTRDAVGLAIDRNLGFVGDVVSIGQLSHALVFLQPAARPDVATPERHTPTSPGDIATGQPGPGSPDWQPPRNAAITPIGGAGNHFQIGPDGGLQLNGRPIDAPPPPPPPADDSTPGSRPKKENEVGLRLDVGFLVNKGGKVARLSDDAPPSDASIGDGDIRLCTIFVYDEDASPDDHLDTEEDDKSNHKKIPKTVKKKKFAAWVKVPPPTSDTHDYSWHNPPPESSSSDSSDSSDGSSGGGSDDGTNDGQGTGSPPGGDQNPNGNRGDVPTYDDAYLNPDGSPTSWNNSSPGSGGVPSTQVQSGFAPPHSPGYMMRGNIFPSDGGEGWNPIGSWMAKKPGDCTDIAIELVCAFSDDLDVVGQCIEVNVIVMAHEDGSGPTDWFRQALVFQGGLGFISDPKEYRARLYFRGFKPAKCEFTILVERRNDTTAGTNSDAEFITLRSSVIPLPLVVRN